MAIKPGNMKSAHFVFKKTENPLLDRRLQILNNRVTFILIKNLLSCRKNKNPVPSQFTELRLQKS